MAHALLLVVIALASSPVTAVSQAKPTLVVQPFTTGPGVELPYDLKMLQGQLVAEFKEMLGKEFEIVNEAPASTAGSVYVLDGVITGWRPGNAAKRILVGMGSGRESTDIDYKVVDHAKKAVVEKKDTIRTNFYSQGAGSTGTLGHPIAQKITERIKAAKLK
jgi:hypothetical protein